jgi:radical SAM protein with 4Fe4S-binding SPASM domain
MEIYQKYPVLKDHIVAMKIKKPNETRIIIYDSITGRKKQINKKVFTFLEQATGSLTCEEISKIVYKKKKESSKKALSELENVINPLLLEGIITLCDSPVSRSRSPPPSIAAVRHLQNVYLELTRECNLSCEHCYRGAGTPREDELTFKEITSLIDQMVDIGVLSITLTGGEPLLHPRIFDIMKYARKKRLSILLFTNGTLIVPHIAQKLQFLPVYKVAVSVDGPDAQIHDGIRGVEGAFQKTLRGIILLKNFEIPTQVNICLSRSNYEKFEEILFLMKHLGVTEFYVRPVTFTGRTSSSQDKTDPLSEKAQPTEGKEEDFCITPVEYLEVLRLLHDFKARELNMNLKKRVMYSMQEINCGIGTKSLTVQSDGTVVPCPPFAQETSLGTIRDQSLLDIWNDSPLLNTLRAMNVFETHPCKECQVVGMCKGGCIGDVYRRSHRFSCYDPFTCASFQVLKDHITLQKVDTVPPEDRLSIHFV